MREKMSSLWVFIVIASFINSTRQCSYNEWSDNGVCQRKMLATHSLFK